MIASCTACQFIQEQQIAHGFLMTSIRPAKPAIACATDETKVRNSDEILLLGPHVCTRISVRLMIGLLKGHCGFANQGKRKFETHFR